MSVGEKEGREGYKMTELGEIPVEWEIKTVQEVSSFCANGFVGTASPFYTEDKNGVLYLQSNNIRENKFDFNKTIFVDRIFTEKYMRAQVQLNDLLTVQSGHIGTSAAVTERLAGSYCHALIITRPRNMLNTNFLSNYLNSSVGRERLSKIYVGSTIKHINVKDFKKFLIPLPPLPEQQKIAVILSTVDEQLETIEGLIEKTKELKKGLMQRLLTKGIGHTEFKQTELGEIPVEWEVKRFDQVCSIKNGLVNPKENPYNQYPHIGNANIEKMTGKLLKYNLAYQDNLTSGKYLFTNNDVLYGKINPQFGKVCYPRFVGVCSADMYPISAEEGQITPQFLKYSLLEVRFTKQMVAASKRTGIPKVNRKEVELYKFILPPLSEQQKIASILSTVDEQIDTYEQEKEKVTELKKGLMQQLLTGKVRVTV